MKRIQMENTNRCQAMNSPRGEMKLTHHLIHRSQKTEKYLFYRIFVLLKFTLELLSGVHIGKIKDVSIHPYKIFIYPW